MFMNISIFKFIALGQHDYKRILHEITKSKYTQPHGVWYRPFPLHMPHLGKWN